MGWKISKPEIKNLIAGEDVELKNAANISYGLSSCYIYYNGQDIKKLLS